METISLVIPYLVLSVQQHIDGRRLIHTRTPFGGIDLSIKRLEGILNPPFFNISVEGDLDTWSIDSQMPTMFKNALFELVGKIAVTHSGWSIYRRCRLVIAFKGATEIFTMTGFLDVSDFKWQMHPERSPLESHIPSA